MREAVLGSLSSFLKAANFDGKREYIKRDGLTQLSEWNCVSGEEEKEKYGQGPILKKLKLKLKILLYDLVLNDDSIMPENPYYVRDEILKDEKLMNNLFTVISNANFDTPQDYQHREYTLRILYRLY